MDEPRTDPRANDEIPTYVLGMELWRIRSAALEAAAIWYDLGQRHHDAEVRRAAAATSRLLYRAVNGANASTGRVLPRWRRWLIVMLGG